MMNTFTFKKNKQTKKYLNVHNTLFEFKKEKKIKWGGLKKRLNRPTDVLPPHPPHLPTPTL